MATSNKTTAMISFKDFKEGILNFDTQYKGDIDENHYFGFPIDPILQCEARLCDTEINSIGYFSMEYGIAPSIYNTFKLTKPLSDANQFFTHEVFSNYWISDYLFKIEIDKMLDIPIYGGGLGVLAGDSIKSTADHGLSVSGIGILWNKGYFKQKFWYKHGQIPNELSWDPHTYPGLIPLKATITLKTKEGPLLLCLWKYYVYSFDKKHACPIILLDSNVEENPDNFRQLTDQLYRSDNVWWKIFQRSILGIGGMKAFKNLNYSLNKYHLNEGHAAFALLEAYVSLDKKEEFEHIRQQFNYTCHTPVEAGHDRFTVSDIEIILEDDYIQAAKLLGKDKKSDLINLTYLCLTQCKNVNAVAKKHGEITRLQFPNFSDKIETITNGVHIHTWLSESFAALFDKYQDTFGPWRHDPRQLKKIDTLKDNIGFREDIFTAHQENKGNLLNVLRRWQLKSDVLTLGWARRITGYKRPALLFHDINRIVSLAKEFGPLQIIFAGKAHPNDDIGSAHIEEILDHIDQLNKHKDNVKVLILENYDTYFGKLLTNSVDVWLNNPLPPFEASGTSGMKAILNGVLQMSTLDGWVVEAEKDNIGWIFGYRHEGFDIGSEKDLRLEEDSDALYTVLAQAMKLYYQTNDHGTINASSAWIDKMIACIKCSAFFNTHRMIQQYNEQMWEPQ